VYAQTRLGAAERVPQYQLAKIKDLQVAAGNSRTPEEQAEHDVFNESSRIVEDTSPAAIRFCSLF
jgi:hypothetical protein